MTETEKSIRNAIVCKSLEERVRQRCLKKSKNLALETTIDICRMFEATKDGMQVISGEYQRVEVAKLAWRNGSTQRSKRPGKPKHLNRAMSSCENAIGVDTTLTNHKKNVQPEMNRVRKLDILPTTPSSSNKYCSTKCPDQANQEDLGVA